MPDQENQGFGFCAAHDLRKTHSIRGKSDSRRVQAILAQMTQIGWDGPPIAVTEYGGEKYILDGHHRTFAARKAEVLVHYRIVSLEELTEYGYNSIEEVVRAHAESGFNRIRLR